MRLRRLIGWLSCACAALLLLALGVHGFGATHAPAFAGVRGSAEPHASAHPPHLAVPEPLTVVGLGDSVVSGTNCPCAPFITRYGALVARATHRPTTVRNLGVPGWTTADLITALRRGGEVARRLPGADIVTVTIGANDMGRARREWAQDGCVACFDRVAATVRANVAKIIQLVRARTGTDPLEVLVTTYWNVFEEVPAAGGDDEALLYGAMAARATSHANRAICAAANQGHAACVDLYQPFKGDDGHDASALLARDRDHPDAAGHQLIASTLAAHGWTELRLPVAPSRS